MNLPILILFTFILNILFSMTSSIVSTNKEIEDESYKYQATLKWLSLCMEIFGIVMSVIYLQPMIHTPLLYIVVLLLVYAYILLSDLLPRKFANAHLNQFEKSFMSIAKGIQSLCTPFTFSCVLKWKKNRKIIPKKIFMKLSTVAVLNQVKKSLSKTYLSSMIHPLKKFVRIEVKLFVYI